jgi:Carboxypeptidase regulatory-like domain
MNLRSAAYRFIAILVPLLLLTIGCGKTTVAKVSGTVSRKDGSHLVGARVIARSDETGKSANGLTNAQGEYELGTLEVGDGVAPGDYYVIVLEERGDEINPRPATIAAKYSKAATSGFKFSVQAGEKKTFDMTLDAK